MAHKAASNYMYNYNYFGNTNYCGIPLIHSSSQLTLEQHRIKIKKKNPGAMSSLYILLD